MKTDSRYYKGLVLVEMVMGSTVYSKTYEKQRFSVNIGTNQISKAPVSPTWSLYRIFREALRFDYPVYNKEFPVFFEAN